MIFLNTFLCLIVSAQFNISPDLDQQAREGHRCARQLKRWIAAKEYEYEYDRDQTRDRYKPFIGPIYYYKPVQKVPFKVKNRIRVRVK